MAGDQEPTLGEIFRGQSRIEKTLSDRMQQSDDRRDEQHQRARESFEALRDQLNLHAAEDAGHFKSVMDRLLVIETERKDEKDQAVKRATWVGVLAASAASALWKAVEHFSK